MTLHELSCATTTILREIPDRLGPRPCGVIAPLDTSNA